MKRKPISKEAKKYQKQVGKRLKELRIEAGYSSAESFAYEYDLGRTQYTGYENGANIQLNSLVKILKALNISLAEFFKDFD